MRRISQEELFWIGYIILRGQGEKKGKTQTFCIKVLNEGK